MAMKKKIQRKKTDARRAAPRHNPRRDERHIERHEEHMPHGAQRAMVISKTFQFDGHWIEKPNRTPIVVCPCGNKYLKTRAGQTKCLRCLARLTIDR